MARNRLLMLNNPGLYLLLLPLPLLHLGLTSPRNHLPLEFVDAIPLPPPDPAMPARQTSTLSIGSSHTSHDSQPPPTTYPAPLPTSFGFGLLNSRPPAVAA
jgi:hypothetical protein